MEIKKLCKDIQNKHITPTHIYKGEGKGYYSIEITTKNPVSHTSLLYNTEKLRNNDYSILENKTFGSLPFNPYIKISDTTK